MPRLPNWNMVTYTDPAGIITDPLQTVQTCHTCNKVIKPGLVALDANIRRV